MLTQYFTFPVSSLDKKINIKEFIKCYLLCFLSQTECFFMIKVSSVDLNKEKTQQWNFTIATIWGEKKREKFMLNDKLVIFFFFF